MATLNPPSQPSNTAAVSGKNRVIASLLAQSAAQQAEEPGRDKLAEEYDEFYDNKPAPLPDGVVPAEEDDV